MRPACGSLSRRKRGMLKHYHIRDYDFKLIILVVAITAIGVLAIGSAKESLQSRQLAGAVFGFF